MSDLEYNDLRAACWRRRLTPEEEVQVQTYLAVHPLAQADWEEDLALTRHLQELPDAPVSSNFTSLVLQAVDAETIPRPRRDAMARCSWLGWWGRLAPRVALAALTVALGVGGLFKYEQIHTRKQVAKDVETFSLVAKFPTAVAGPEAFEDFDAIQKLQPVSFSTDEDLLAALR